MKKIMLVLLALSSLIMLFGCQKNYDTAEEAWAEEWNGDYNDLAFCSIDIVSRQDGLSLVYDFAFISVRNPEDCQIVHNQCEKQDCQWQMHTIASSKNGKGWVAEHQPSCVCFINGTAIKGFT